MFGIYIIEETHIGYVLAEQFTNRGEATESLRRYYFGQGIVCKIGEQPKDIGY